MFDVNLHQIRIFCKIARI